MKVNSNYFKRRYTYGNKKKNYTLIVLFLTLFFTVGYAYLNTLLSINGTVKVNKNTWNVHFENIQKVDGSIDATADATISNNTTVDFTVDLQMPGEFYSFTVDVVNSGTIDAMLSEILKTGLTTEQEVYTEYTVTYSDGEEILEKDSLPSGMNDTLLITIKYKDDITAEQLPTEDQNINLSLEANYIQDDGTSDSRRPPKTLNDIVIMQNKENGRMVLDNQASNYVSASTGIMLYEPASDTNGKGVYVRNGTENNSYPIYYYRGTVENNNVIFAGFCWKIVRTTETGGVKLVYNGVPNNGTCNNTGEASQIGTSKFNSGTGYNSYVGYMYGTPNSSKYEDEHKNERDSTIKKYIDEWYKNNLINYKEFLEDTIWCNDRTLYNEDHPGTGAGTSETYYGPYGRVMQYEGLSFECENQNDRFTVDEEMEGRVNGNGMLTYPIALLTADEVAIAGNGEHSYNNKNTYLVTGKTWWTMSPYAFLMWDELIPFVYTLSSWKDAWMYEVWLSVGVRPAISLKYGTLTNGMGDGSVGDPYVVDCGESEIVIQGNDDIVANFASAITGTTITLSSISGDNKINSFKMNGELVTGTSFIMPEGNVVISEINVTTKGTITIEGNSDIKSNISTSFSGATITLSSISGDNKINSFKMNGELVTGTSFTMPEGNAIITEINVTTKGTITIEGNDDIIASSTSYSIYNKITKAFSNAKVYLHSKSGNNIINSFKMNGQLITGTSFTMPEGNVVISEINVTTKGTITIEGNSDIKSNVTAAFPGTTITLSSISGNNVIKSFKMNGELVKGASFIMPDSNVVITDLTFYSEGEYEVIESEHNPYPNNLDNVVYGEKAFEGATSLTVYLDYQAENTNYDWVYLYDSETSTTPVNNKKYGGTTRTTEIITINGNYVKIVFRTDSVGNNFYGFRAIIIPNYD